MGKHMRLLFSAIAIAAGLAVTASTVSAQDAAGTEKPRAGRGEGGSRMGGGGNIFRVALELQGITADQKEKIEKLQSDFRQKMQDARKAQTKDSGDSKAGEGSRGGWNSPEMQKLMKDSRTEVEKILTDDQKKELEKKTAEARSRRGNRETTGTAETKKP